MVSMDPEFLSLYENEEHDNEPLNQIPLQSIPEITLKVNTTPTNKTNKTNNKMFSHPSARHSCDS